jgi:hypothetical protein
MGRSENYFFADQNLDLYFVCQSLSIQCCCCVIEFHLYCYYSALEFGLYKKRLENFAFELQLSRALAPGPAGVFFNIYFTKFFSLEEVYN